MISADVVVSLNTFICALSAYKRLQESDDPEIKKQVQALEDRLAKYQQRLDEFGLHDYQVRLRGDLRRFRVCVCVSLLPLMLLRLPRLLRLLRQVPTLKRRRTWRMVYKLTHMTSVFVLASLPTVLLNAPVGLLAKYLAEKERVRVRRAELAEAGHVCDADRKDNL